MLVASGWVVSMTPLTLTWIAPAEVCEMTMVFVPLSVLGSGVTTRTLLTTRTALVLPPTTLKVSVAVLVRPGEAALSTWNWRRSVPSEVRRRGCR